MKILSFSHILLICLILAMVQKSAYAQNQTHLDTLTNPSPSQPHTAALIAVYRGGRDIIYDDEKHPPSASLPAPAGNLQRAPWNCGRKYLRHVYTNDSVSFAYTGFATVYGGSTTNVVKVLDSAKNVLYTTTLYAPDTFKYAFSTPGTHYIAYYYDTAPPNNQLKLALKEILK